MLRLQEVLVLFCPFDQRRVSKVAQPAIDRESARARARAEREPSERARAGREPRRQSFWVFLSVIWVCDCFGLLVVCAADRPLASRAACLPMPMPTSACDPAMLLRRSAHLHAYLLLFAWLAAFRGSTILSSSAIRPKTDILTQ